jgi:hypothetical protein
MVAPQSREDKMREISIKLQEGKEHGTVNGHDEC